MSKKIRLVTPDNSLNKTLYITTNDGKPNIGYKINDQEQELILSLDKKDRPLYCSELVNLFRDCKWFISKRVIIKQSPSDEFGFDIYFGNKEEKENLPIYFHNSNESLKSLETKLDNNWWETFWNDLKKGLGESLSEDLIREIDSQKVNIENMAKTNEIYLYDNSTSKIDFLNTQNTICLVEYNSDVYTDTVDLKKILSGIFCKSNITSSKVDLSIQYTKKTKDGNVCLLNHDTTFEGFYISGKNIEITNFIETVSEDVDIEYLNGIIKLYPKNNNIIECIISNCTVSYGNVNE